MHFAKIFATGAAIALVIAASACGKKNDADVNALDQALAGNAANEVDPALTSALSDQIMVDPTLAQQSNRNAIRAPDGPATAPIPPDTGPGGQQPIPPTGALRAPAPTPAETAGDGATTLGALAAAQARGTVRGAARGCEQQLEYSAVWASRLPEAIPVYPGGRVSEGAGADAAGCSLRVVSFTANAPLTNVIDWYYTRAIRAGYSSEHQVAPDGEHILAGARGRDDSAYYLLLSDKGGRTEVDIIASGAR